MRLSKEGEGTQRRFAALAVTRVTLFGTLLFALLIMLGGCGLLRELLNPNKAPVAIIRVDLTFGEAPLEVTFDGSSSYDPDGGDVVAYEWDFEDGKRDEGQVVRHGFGEPGDYSVTLTVADSKGATGASRVVISVLDPSQVSSSHSYDAAAGTEVDTGMGLTVHVPPAPGSGQTMLLIKCDLTPQPTSYPGVDLRRVYAVSFHPESQGSALRLQEEGVYLEVRFVFDIPSGVTPDAAVVLLWSSEGWVVAPSAGPGGGAGGLGGTLSADRTKLSVQIPVRVGGAGALRLHGWGSVWDWVTDRVRLAIAELKDTFDCSPVYPEILEFGCEDMGTHQKKLVSVSSPDRGFGGIWFKVAVEGIENLAGDPQWEPPSQFEVERVFASRGWYLSPSDGRPGVITLSFPAHGGKAVVVLDAGDSLEPQIVAWIVRLVPMGEFVEGFAEFLWGTVSAVLDAVNQDFPSLAVSWGDAVRKGLAFAWRFTKEISETVFAEGLARHLFEKYKYRFARSLDTAMDACRITARKLVKAVLTPLRLAPLAANILTYSWTIASRQAGYCEHGRCAWEVLCRTLRDTAPPVVTSLSVSPDSVSVGGAFTISFSAADSGGSGLKHVELHRANDSGGNPVDWAEIKRTPASGNSYSGSFTDAPTSAGTYWFGLRVVDNAGNWNDEKNSVTGGSPRVYGPIKRVVNPPSSAQKPAPPRPLEPGSSGPPGPMIAALTPTFRWERVANAERYALAISIEPYGPGSVIYRNEDLAGTSFTLPSGVLAHGGKYRWNMQARNGTDWSDVSSPLYFQISLPPTGSVILTLYVHDGSLDGQVIVGARVQGSDAAGIQFDKTTNDGGYVTITGEPGTWAFTVSKSGYMPKSWSQPVSDSGTARVSLQKEESTPPGGCTVTVGPGESIQAAIDAAPAGAVVCLGAGEFYLPSGWTVPPLTITKPLTLQGQGAEATTLIQQGSVAIIVDTPYGDVRIADLKIQSYACNPDWYRCAVYIAKANRLVIENCTLFRDCNPSNCWGGFLGPISGIWAEGVAVEMIIRDCTVSGFTLGIWAGVSATVTIEGCVITGTEGFPWLCGKRGILVTDNGYGVSDVTIKRCTISDLAMGILLCGEARVAIEDNQVLRNLTYGIALGGRECGAYGCPDDDRVFTGLVTGRRNRIPGPGEIDGNGNGGGGFSPGAAVCPSDLSFLVTSTGGTLDRRR